MTSETGLRVCLVKTDDHLGSLCLGSRYEALFDRATPPDVARVRTYRMLKRDNPDENPMCWTVDGG
jgi:hypothetical protein